MIYFSIGTLALASYESQVHDAETSEAAYHCDEHKNLFLTKMMVNTLNKDGIVIIESMLTKTEVDDAINDSISVITEGRMQLANADYRTIRQDEICFIRKSDGTNINGNNSNEKTVNEIGSGLLHCISILRGLTFQLERLGYDRSYDHKVPMQCQLAYYPAILKHNSIAGYLPHRDAASDVNFWQIGLLGWLRGKDYRKRSITAILYLNALDWDCDPSKDGGALKCYLDADYDDNIGTTSKHIKYINPKGGTLVLFDSRYLLHEVAPAYRNRIALTLWVTGNKTKNN